MTTIHANKKVLYTLAAHDDKGNPAPLVGIPVWSISTTGAVSIVPAADGMSAEVTWLAPSASVVLTVTADAGPAPTVTPLTVSDTIETLASVATVLLLTVGPEVDA